MKHEATIALITALAYGCDPETGEELEPTHLLRRKAVTAALNEALKALGGKPAKRPRRPIISGDYFSRSAFNSISARSRKELVERVLKLPMSYPLDQSPSRIIRTEHARSQEPWKPMEQELLAKALPYTNDLKFLSIVFQRSEKAVQMEARRLMAERESLRSACAVSTEASGTAAHNEGSPKAYSVAKLREEHAQAYAPWTEADDARLEQLFSEGRKNKELAKILGRQPGAIASRIRKLELRIKYGK